MSGERKAPVTRQEGGKIEEASSRSEIDAFLKQAHTMTPANTGGARGRLIFALDATMSRQPTWDSACQLQAEMFNETAQIGGLDVQLLYFRGFNECRASRWVSDPKALADLMTRIDCRGGHTQIRRALAHVRNESRKKPVQALVYIGDCMEESIDDLCAVAGEIGMTGTRAFMFHEGRDAIAEKAFREIARLTNGAYCRFDTGSAQHLRELLAAVAVYAAGGRAALVDYGRKGGGQARLLLQQMR
ncbi:VWA domain-containing protein [Microbaculum marinisediminis]|uniref:VWA domain-containing protein n=1 Tax=Microbaculum marinisediminis TaxID=2931392 RepID=A0AAW5R210_9HYPH|nr:VWA domain-containing protein [Microbaculum sp. A6E488]MCT8973154.1 VWA domain-containing protein [Microbaculum sp. A6E488]